MNKGRSEYYRHQIQLYGGILAGLVFLACAAGLLGLTTNLSELVCFLAASFTTGILFHAANEACS